MKSKLVTKTKTTKGKIVEADHSPIKVGDNVKIVSEYKTRVDVDDGDGNGGGGGGNGPKKPKKPSLRDLFLEFRDESRDRFDKIDSRLDRLEQRVEGIDTTLKTVIRVNNLKTE